MSDLDFGKLFNAETPMETRREYEQIPTDKYQVVVKDAAVELGGKAPRVVLNYRIVDDNKFKNRILFSSFTLNEVGASLLKKSLKKLGVNVSAVKSLDDLNTELMGIHGKDCEVFAKAREYTKTDGSTGYAHNVYVNSSPYDLDNQPQANEPLLKGESAMKADDFKF